MKSERKQNLSWVLNTRETIYQNSKQIPNRVQSQVEILVGMETLGKGPQDYMAYNNHLCVWVADFSAMRIYCRNGFVFFI